MKILLILIITAVALGFVPQSQVTPKDDAAWKQIIVLQSTRSDVEKLLGKSEPPRAIGVYDFPYGHLFIDYEDWNFCENGKGFGWNIPKGTVTEVHFRPYTKIQFSSLNLDLTRFKKVRESPHCPDLITFRNDEEGVAYTTNLDGTLNSIDYFPSSQYDYLRCKVNDK